MKLVAKVSTLGSAKRAETLSLALCLRVSSSVAQAAQEFSLDLRRHISASWVLEIQVGELETKDFPGQNILRINLKRRLAVCGLLLRHLGGRSPMEYASNGCQVKVYLHSNYLERHYLFTVTKSFYQHRMGWHTGGYPSYHEGVNHHAELIVPVWGGG